MHTVELLNESVEVATKLGYQVRQEWLGGGASGHCLLRGRRVLLLDVGDPPDVQLSAVHDALQGELFVSQIAMSPELAACLDSGQLG